MTDYAKGFSLVGKVALVSGAARGIGAEIAIALGTLRISGNSHDRHSDNG